MIIIGLTGSIGMGKSTTARLMAEMGIPNHSADDAIHAAYAAGGKGVPLIKQKYPSVIDIDENGNEFVNRQKLGQIVFNDPEKLKQLEDIIHPLVKESEQVFLQDCREKGLPFAVLDIPLLYETGAVKRVDVTFCVSAPKDIQRARVLKRPGMTEEKFENILKRQVPDAEKRKKADFVITTDVSLENTKEQLYRAIEKLKGTPCQKSLKNTP
jgi:dephospho-CoA kinase